MSGVLVAVVSRRSRGYSIIGAGVVALVFYMSNPTRTVAASDIFPKATPAPLERRKAEQHRAMSTGRPPLVTTVLAASHLRRRYRKCGSTYCVRVLYL